ncbi:MAG: hypothetical protein ACE366_20385 [Bradymonadia bacterium]
MPIHKVAADYPLECKARKARLHQDLGREASANIWRLNVGNRGRQSTGKSANDMTNGLLPEQQ